jgi:hypothetical protein
VSWEEINRQERCRERPPCRSVLPPGTPQRLCWFGGAITGWGRAWPTRPDPGPELQEQGGVVRLAELAQERRQVCLGQLREGKAIGPPLIAPALENVECQSRGVQPPNFGYTQGRIDAHPVQGTVCDIDLDGQIGWWIASQVQLSFALHGSSIGDPVTVVRFQATLFAPAAKRDGPTGTAGHLQFFRQNIDHPTQEVGLALMLPQGTHHFQGSTVVSKAKPPPFENAQKSRVGSPVDVTENSIGERCGDRHNLFLLPGRRRG